VACESIDLSIGVGEIHGLIGENGAGKSTLVKIIYGLVRPDSGSVKFNQHPISDHKPSDAKRAGISLIFQHFALIDSLTVFDNVRLGLSGDGDLSDLRGRLLALAKKYALHIDVDRRVSTLSVSEKQRIEILRCLLQAPKLLMMDEPTSVLTPQEIDRLLKLIRQIARDGCSVLFISHKLHEVKSICQRITIMRKGQLVHHGDVSDIDVEQMAEYMIGTRLKAASVKSEVTASKQLLSLTALNLADRGDSEVSLTDIHLTLGIGEILGIAGVAGNGQNEFLETLSGERRPIETSAITLEGEPIGHLGTSQRRRRGLCFVPEDRLGHGSVASMNLTDNVVLTGWDSAEFSGYGLIRYGRASLLAESIIQRFDVRTNGIEDLAGQLSGGNLQKFIVGREILHNPRILVIAHPTWGVDAAAALAIRSALVEIARDGAGVIVVSQDLDELFEITNHIAVLNNGRLSEKLDTATVNASEIGMLMGADSKVSVAKDDGHALAN